jgi:hypothetical protein
MDTFDYQKNLQAYFQQWINKSGHHLHYDNLN